ncbi:MAG TPA: PTS lactose transporter subunit IIB [Pseudonocardiaceae bacterium]|jgi:PTS system mannitol-specific IIB component|nr:PTS lactose transporter subunit IIB [Pseudonocardiaceae bacterium]
MNAITGSQVRKIVVACDAGMGSSVLVASQLSSALKAFSVTVDHTPVNGIPADADIVLCQRGLVARVRSVVPEKVVLGFQLFLGDPVFDQVTRAIKDGERLVG